MGCGNSEQVTNVGEDGYHSAIQHRYQFSRDEVDSELAMEELGQRVDFDGNIVSLYDRKENRPEESGDFKPVENIEGEEFLAVRPWLGQFRDPSNPPQVNKSPPDQTLKPHYVYGYRCADIRHNLYYNEGYGNVVYCIASIGVIMNKASKDQILFGCGENKTTKGHTDDIISLAVCPHRRLVATGETGRNPKVYVWSAQTGEIMSFYKCKRVRGIKTIGFSKSSKYVGFSCLDNDHTVYLVDPHGKKKCKLLGSGKGGPGAFFDMAFSTVDEGTFVTIGKRSKYWTYENGVLDSCSLKFGSQKRTTLIVGTFTDQGTLVCGGSNGRLYICQGSSCTKTIKIHKGPIFAIHCNKHLITGGKDKTLKVFKNGDTNSDPDTIKLHHYARGLDQNPENGLILVGGRDGVIYEYDYNGQKQDVLMAGHSDGEVWGLSIHPSLPNIVVTSCDDNKICVWDMEKRCRIGKGTVNKKRGKKKKIGGASTLSRFPPNQCSRAVAIHPNNGHIAVSDNEGQVTIRADYNDIDNIIKAFRDTKQWNEVMEYSPDGNWLAVGSHDNRIRVYDVNSDYQKVGRCTGHSSYIHCLDWSVDSNSLRTVCGGYELLYWTKDGQQVKDGATAYRDEQWATQASKFGWYTDGIYPSGVDGTHVNGTARSPDGKLLLTATDYGEVNLFRNPCRMGSRPKIFVGHSEHVVRAKFDPGQKNVYSIGGQDKAVIHWKVC